jgi:hypothetical protein
MRGAVKAEIPIGKRRIIDDLLLAPMRALARRAPRALRL